MNEMPHNDWREPPDDALYAEVDGEADRLYGTGDLAAAFKLLDETWPGLPGETMHPRMQDPLLYKAYLLSQLDRAEEAIEAVRALHRSGYSCSLTWSGFDSIRSLDGYDEVERENTRLVEEERKLAKLEYRVHLPDGYDVNRAYPLVLALHGDGGNMTKMQTYWPSRPMLERGYIVVYVQSSQLVHTNNFAWLPDPEIAWTDVRVCHEQVCRQHKIDASSLILAGFSGGAITSVDLAFGEALPITAFIALSPEIKPEHFTEEAVTRAVERGVRGVFIEGELVWPLDDEQEMETAMRNAGLPIKLILNEGYGHAAPPDFDVKLNQALDFVLN